ncbi:MAG: RNA polymerase subunit sigma [Planctomycetia bacterium]|nr:RNA polymerase subunit sigma [Planctomycetia bacterium]
MTVLHSGSTPKYAEGWESIFSGGKKSAGSKAAARPGGKKPAARKSAKKSGGAMKSRKKPAKARA